MTDSSSEKQQDDPQAKFNRVHQGETLDFSELSPGLNKIMIGLGWDMIGFEADAPDLDASVFLLNKEGLTRQNEDFIYYNNMTALDGAIEHKGDNRTGAGDGDDENIVIDLDKIPFDIMKIQFVVSIYDAQARGHSFLDVRNVFFRVVDSENKRELFRYFLDGELKANERGTALKVGYIFRDGNKWMFTAEGELVEDGLNRVATTYGMIIAG